MISRYGETGPSLAGLATFKFATKDYVGWELDSQRALELNRDSVLGYLFTGAQLDVLGRRDEARRTWQAGLAIVRKELNDAPQSVRLKSIEIRYLAALEEREAVESDSSELLRTDNATARYSVFLARTLLGDDELAIGLASDSLSKGDLW
ncbi:MAG: hypothetical protein ACREQY_23910, partial [Candidatus Binatia bacterium]